MGASAARSSVRVRLPALSQKVSAASCATPRWVSGSRSLSAKVERGSHALRTAFANSQLGHTVPNAALKVGAETLTSLSFSLISSVSVFVFARLMDCDDAGVIQGDRSYHTRVTQGVLLLQIKGLFRSALVHSAITP